MLPHALSPSEVPADDREATQLNCNRCWIPTTREYPLEIRKNTIIKSYCHNIGLRKLGAFVVLLVSQFFAIPDSIIVVNRFGTRLGLSEFIYKFNY